MTLRGRSAAALSASAAAVVLSAGAVAWACTPYPDGESFGTTPEAPVQSQDRPVTQSEVQPQAQPVSEPQPVTVSAAPAPATVKAPSSNRTVARLTARSTPVATATPVVAQRAPVAAPPPVTTTRLPSMSSVAGDLWSGFGAGPSKATARPGLATPTPVSSRGHDGSLALGLGLLGGGIAALALGTGTVAARRASARAANTPPR
ncbi:MAG TPA: hypothetical protein VMZ51_04665 [Acidimicrobiales bacterium]|nr:hypothetical protein [Acidimicrobiales bacterium]